MILLILFLINNKNVCSGNDIEITTLSSFRRFIIDIEQLEKEYNRDREQLKIDKENLKYEKELSEPVYETDVIHLNIGGEIIATTRETWISYSKSLLSILFNGRWERRLPCDNDGNIVLVEYGNSRITVWKNDATTGQIVICGNIQLNGPNGLIIDHFTNEFVIADNGNKRVVRCSRQDATNSQTIISNVLVAGLAMNKYGDLYVVDQEKHEVRRWKTGDKEGVLVAGGNGRGTHLNQLSAPRYFFVDENESVYVSDLGNHRVTKWIKDAKEEIIVAGGHGQGNSLKQ